ncbi:MAG: hypothetical protein HRU00_12380 [Myxococcales bacterium]|nr:hypothetical protein [Myxococcales bacterium]
MSKIADALAWLAADKSRGYRRASREFGLPASDIKRARLEQKTSAKAAGPISRLEWVAWLAANPGGAKMDCIRELRPAEDHRAGGPEYDRLWRYEQKTDPVVPAPAPRDAPREPMAAMLDRRQWAIMALADVEADIATERGKRNPSAAGLSSLHRSARELRDTVDRAEVQAIDELDGMTHDEQIEWLRAQAETWSDAHLETVLLVYAERLNVQLLAVHEGYRSALTDDGWQSIG